MDDPSPRAIKLAKILQKFTDEDKIPWHLVRDDDDFDNSSSVAKISCGKKELFVAVGGGNWDTPGAEISVCGAILHGWSFMPLYRAIERYYRRKKLYHYSPEEQADQKMLERAKHGRNYSQNFTNEAFEAVASPLIGK